MVPLSPRVSLVPDIAAYPKLLPPTVGEHAEQIAHCSMSSRGGRLGDLTMDIVYARCAGLDVHKKTVVACVRVMEPGRKVRPETRRFGTIVLLQPNLEECSVRVSIT